MGSKLQFAASPHQSLFSADLETVAGAKSVGPNLAPPKITLRLTNDFGKYWGLIWADMDRLEGCLKDGWMGMVKG